MKKFLFVCLGLIITWFTYGFYQSFDPNTYREALYYSTLKKVNSRLAKKYQLKVCGIGGGQKEGKITIVSVIFNRYQGPLSIEEGRELIVNCVEEYLDAFNNDEKIRDLMVNDKLLPRNIEMGIINCQKDGTGIPEPDMELFANSAKGLFFVGLIPEITQKLMKPTKKPMLS
jgi:hypothetical protein